MIDTEFQFKVRFCYNFNGFEGKKVLNFQHFNFYGLWKNLDFIYLDLIQIELFLFVEKLNRSIDALFQDNQSLCSINSVHFLDVIQYQSQMISVAANYFSENGIITCRVVSAYYLRNRL